VVDREGWTVVAELKQYSNKDWSRGKCEINPVLVAVEKWKDRK
jgi:hypothetical protein